MTFIDKLIQRLESRHALLLLFIIGGISIYYFYGGGQERPFPIPDGEYNLVENNTDYDNKTKIGKILSQTLDITKQQLMLSKTITIRERKIYSNTFQDDKILPIQKTNESDDCYVEIDVLGNTKHVMLKYNQNTNILAFQFPNEEFIYEKR